MNFLRAKYMYVVQLWKHEVDAVCCFEWEYCEQVELDHKQLGRA